jgi:ribosomal-protein-alanine acetyltransferase
MQKYSQNLLVDVRQPGLMLPHVKIRPATPDDIPQVISLEQSTPAAAHWIEEQYSEMLREGGPQRLLLIAEEENTLLGFLVARRIESEWEIENIAVITERQRSGLGSALVGQVLQHARMAAATSLILEVRESNIAARALYENLGFVREGHRKGYYRAPNEDAVLYRLRVTY